MDLHHRKNTRYKLPFTKHLKIVIGKWAPYCDVDNIIIDKHILVKAPPLQEVWREKFENDDPEI